MRKIVLLLSVVILCGFAADAAACARCNTNSDGCAQCYESTGDGAQSCYLLNGEWCVLVEPGTCEGWDGSWCQGDRCPEDREALRAEPERQWRLASYEVIRPSAAKSSS